MGTCTDSFINMVDAHLAHAEKIVWFKSKVADLENCSRCNNLKIRGVLESLQPSQCPHYARDLFQAVLPSLTSADLMINRIHRIPKPSFLPDEVPWDVHLWMHYFQAKETVLILQKKLNFMSMPHLYKLFLISPRTLYKDVKM